MTVSEQALAASRDFMRAADRLPTFYSLSAAFNGLLDLLESDEQDEAAILAELERLGQDIRQKAHGIAVVINALEHMAEAQSSEAKRLSAKAKANENHAQRLRQYTLGVMKELELPRIETGPFTLAIRQNPPSVVVEDAAAVPSDYQRTRIEISVDKRAILDAFKSTGEIPPGVAIVRTERIDLR